MMVSSEHYCLMCNESPQFAELVREIITLRVLVAIVTVLNSRIGLKNNGSNIVRDPHGLRC